MEGPGACVRVRVSRVPRRVPGDDFGLIQEGGERHVVVRAWVLALGVMESSWGPRRVLPGSSRWASWGPQSSVLQHGRWAMPAAPLWRWAARRT